jgi:hypothetical protein
MSPDTDDERSMTAKNLTLALGLLENYWDKISADLTPEQQSQINAELLKLEPKIKKCKDLTEISEEAEKFLETFSTIEPLTFLSNLNEPMKRGASLISPEEDVKIKILNYCIKLEKKIQTEK